MLKNLKVTLILLSSSMLFASCASKDKGDAPPTKVPHQPTTWNYDKIRDVRNAESAQQPGEDASSDEDLSNCTIMSKEEMIRGRATGCRPLDPRLGNGDNSFCCPAAKK